MDKQNVKIETEKMLAGEIYDPMEKDLVSLRQRAHRLSKEYNECLETDEKREQILDELMPNRGKNVYLQSPVQFDYGRFTQMGENSYANFNFTCLDCAPVTIGKNVFMGPNVSLLTPVHPMRYQDRNMYRREDGVMTDKEYARPIVVGGVTIGEGCVIGAGSVVTKDIPAGMFAAGVPCKVIREITEEDKL